MDDHVRTVAKSDSEPQGSQNPIPTELGNEAGWSIVCRHGPRARTLRSRGPFAETMRAENGFPELAQDESEQEMNVHIAERLDHRPARVRQTELTSQASASTAKFTDGGIRDYIRATQSPAANGSWLSLPEIPTSEEILGVATTFNLASTVGVREPSQTGHQGEDIGPKQPDDVYVPTLENKIDRPWNSTEEYLGNHYALLREDGVIPLREAVARVKENPMANEEFFGGDVGIYEDVHITALTFGTRGIAIRVAFSLARLGKRIHWDQSKRLITGSLVVLTPANDMFDSQCKVAVVAARPLAFLELNPPEIDLYFASADDIELDSQRDWVMVEARGAFFEAERHTLLALQKLMSEPFPLSEHLVGLQQQVDAPRYVQEQPLTDLSSAFTAGNGDVVARQSYENVDILANWPTDPHSELDQTQLAALRRMLTKRLAIVQGPPGTGKTHVSVVALKILLSNMSRGDPPIVVACQTNHALDQLLRYIAVFEPDFVRLGSRSKDVEVIKKRTLFVLRQEFPAPPTVGRQRALARKAMKDLEKSMMVLLAPLNSAVNSKGPLDYKTLERLNILTKDQCDSLERAVEGWVSHEPGASELSPMAHWLGSSLVPAQRKTKPDDFGFEFEEVDLEFEQLKEMEAENVSNDDEDLEILFGTVINIGDSLTGKKLAAGVRDKDIEKLLEVQDLTKIKQKARGEVYRYFQRKVKEKIVGHLKPLVKKYLDATINRKAGGWEADCWLLRQQGIKIIGMTTTGLSKYRALISGLKPKIILIEEAAETLEAPVIAACVESLEHLILVGDHQQLRPHCHVKEHEMGEGRAFNLNVSLFERLVINNVEFDTLLRQRRMIPEIRRILRPIYGDKLEDHPYVMDVNNRPPIPGMGGINSYFLTHEWPETRDDHMSSCNIGEAEMIVGFFNYLVFNGVPVEQITVLTFYNGQRKTILRMLRSHPNLSGVIFKVVTVDSYQGEENGVVLLSLVRSNEMHRIGFLSVGNRVCVALSRAQRGFYIFGNGQLLCGENKLWVGVIEIMAGKTRERPATGPKRRLGYALPLQCSEHGRKVWIQDASDWDLINGGCEQKCHGKLSCGHPCYLMCHPFLHSQVNCHEPCEQTLSCGHQCDAECSEPCLCRKCTKGRAAAQFPAVQSVSSSELALIDPELSHHAQSWKEFANGKVVEDDQAKHQKAVDSAVEERQRLLDEENERNLFDLGDGKVAEGEGIKEERQDIEEEDLMSVDGTSAARPAWERSVSGRRIRTETYRREGKERIQEVSLLDL